MGEMVFFIHYRTHHISAPMECGTLEKFENQLTASAEVMQRGSSMPMSH